MFLLFSFILNEDGIGLDGHTFFGLTGALPQADSDLLDDLYYLAMLSGALGGSMLKLLDNFV
jgi:hypothetical protein